MSNEAPTTPTTPPPATPAAPPPVRRKRRFRWVARGAVVLLVLALLLASVLAGVQYALMNTEYARNIALPIIERKLGLRLHVGTLRVDLFRGRTVLTKVDAGLPLDEADFLHVSTITVKHANLLGIILNLGVPLDDVTIDQPQVDVVQDGTGHWNLLQVADILGKLGGSNDAQPTATSGGVPRLPAVHLVDGTIQIDDGKAHHATVAPLDVTGQPSPDGLVFAYDLTAGPATARLLAVHGRVAPGNNWTHHVTLALGNLDPLARAFGVPSTYAAAVNAAWDGQLVNGKVAGRLTLGGVSAQAVPTLGRVAVTGAVDVATGGPAPAPGPAGAAAADAAGVAPLVTLSPSNLQVTTGSNTVPSLGVTAGSIVYDSTGLHTRGLKVNALGGAASLDASADPKTQNVDLAAHWNGLTLKAGISQSGSLTASLRQPFPGQPLVHVELDDRGSIGGTPATAAAAAADLPASAGTRWDAAVEVTGQGTTFGSIDWVLAVPRLNVDSGGKFYDLSGLSAQVRQRPTTVDLIGLTLPPAAGAATTVAVATPTAGTTAGGAAGTTGGGSRSNTAVPAARTSGSPFGLTFASSAHVTLPDLSLRPPRPLSWKASVSGGLTASYQGTPVPVTLAVDADGNDKLYTLRKFLVTAADANLSADGTYDTSNPKPVALHVNLTQTPRITPDAPVQGNFGGEFKVVGLLFDVDPAADAADAAAAAAADLAASTQPATLEPTTEPTTGPTTGLSTAATTAPVTAPTTAPTTAPAVPPQKRFRPYLTTTGDLRARELVVFGKPIGDLDVKVAGDVQTPHPRKTENGPAAANAPPPAPVVHAELHSTDFYLFQAPWSLAVDYAGEDGVARLDLSTARLPLDVLAKAAGVPEGTITGSLAAAHWRVTASGLGVSGLDLTSDYHLTGLSAAGLNVDTVDATAGFHDGVFSLDPVVAKSGTGTARLSATYNLKAPTHVMTHVAVDRWPYPLGSALGGTTEARADARVDLDVDLATKGANGTATAALDVLLHPTLAGHSGTQTLAHAQVAAALRGRTLDVDDVSGRVLNGTFKGSLQADVDKPLEAAGRLEWQDVDVGTLGAVTGNAALADLGGKFAGTVTVAPSRDPRSLEPVRIDVNVTASDDAHFRTVRLGDPARLLMTHAVAYANIDRAVLDHSDVYVGGGIVHLWGRVGRGLASQTALVDFAGLQLDQLAHLSPAQCTDPAPGTVPGTLNGSLRVIRSGSALAGLTGGGHADLVDADLVNLKAIRKLYDILQASAGGLQPVGRGGADFDLQASTIRLNSFRFYNRGVDAHGLLTLGPVDGNDILASRIGGNVVGTERLFKGSRLPLISDFDQTFSALQSNLTTINVRGTLGSPIIGQGALDDISSQLQQLIVGDAQQDAQNGGG